MLQGLRSQETGGSQGPRIGGKACILISEGGGVVEKALQEWRRAWEACTWAGKSSEDSLRDVRSVWGQG